MNSQRRVNSKIRCKLERVEEDRNKLEHHLEGIEDVPDVHNHQKNIVELPIDELIQKLQDGSLTCVQVLRAYQTKVMYFSLRLCT